MKLQLEQKHKEIIAAPAPVLVTGGPGSGKTTTALLKAKTHVAKLERGQEVLFLSFTRSAIRQILSRGGEILSSNERKAIQVNTYHQFCIDTLAAHGPLLCGKQVSFLYPSEERLRKSTHDGDWATEQKRLAEHEGVFCFDLVAPTVAELFTRSHAVRTLYADKYPFVIVDEFQDTNDEQWRLVQSFLGLTEVFCLADPEQRIFDYQPDVDPRRLEALRDSFNPMEFDLGNDNHRSPATGILAFADGILNNRTPRPNPSEVSVLSYHNQDAFAATTHAAVIWTLSRLRRNGIEQPNLAVLCRSNSFVAQLSAVLGEQHTYKNRDLPPIEHDVMWDADLSAAAAQVVGAILEWPTKEASRAVHDTVRLIAHFYRIKNAGAPSKGAAMSARKFDDAAEAITDGKKAKVKAVKEMMSLAERGLSFVGNSVNDWRQARRVLYDIKALNELYREARLVRLFRATDALGAGLDQLWLREAQYSGAACLLKSVLDGERLLSADRDPRGCTLMTIHKAKAREFDGVVLVEGAYKSQFFDEKRERRPYQRSRRLLRVGITRARKYVTIVRPAQAIPLIDHRR